MKKILLATLAGSLIAATGLSAITVDEIIDKARARLGTEEALTSVETLYYEGTIEEMGQEESVTGEVKLRFMRPFRQRMDTVAGGVKSTMAVNDYEGFIARLRLEDGASQIGVMPPEQVARLRSNTAENLYFFNGPRRQGGEIELLGEENYNGTSAYVVSFSYPSGVQFERLFSQENFKLLATRPAGDANVEFVEEGETIVKGIKFPKRVRTLQDGELVRLVTFENVYVNEKVSPEIFRFPTTSLRGVETTDDEATLDVDIDKGPGEDMEGLGDLEDTTLDSPLKSPLTK